MSLVWISGASGGIGAALAAAVPFDGARVIDISRRGGTTDEHFAADLADPAAWPLVERHFVDELQRYDGPRAVFVHNAGTINPIGSADEVDPDEYTRAVLLNSAAPQILGRAFLRASAHLSCPRFLVMLTSGAARTPYPGWSSYAAGKASVDHWVRTVGAEQGPAGCQVVAVGPGVVDTDMQAVIRQADFPAAGRFRELAETGGLSSPAEAAAGIWSVLGRGLPNGSVVDLRTLA
ncbi:SDR family NAD(P)-dependent oxidoreductase [Kribbella sp. NBC_01245]|uniref:SDR family NAD(P)-dependent oxidoreductase n=1 Tax=Kribbella sp. NBC_01245 TaxID=2903578 RepID=UPI002E2847A0|nr:SDR family NAD(P)-dependent oxidoreductase [Kribbella sp. NBC_01245]